MRFQHGGMLAFVGLVALLLLESPRAQAWIPSSWRSSSCSVVRRQACSTLTILGRQRMYLLDAKHGMDVVNEDPYNKDDDDETTSPSLTSLASPQREEGKFASYYDRRRFLLQSAGGWMVSSSLLSSSLLWRPAMAVARPGLVQFPCNNPDAPLVNTYHVLRAGPSLYEEPDQDLYSTNPLFLTNRDDGLSETGMENMRQLAQRILTDSPQHVPTLIKYSLAARCMDAATVLGREWKVGKDRNLPEYTYLDPRAIGQWDLQRLSTTEPAIWAMDVAEATTDGQQGRPPPNQDGTPHETIADAAIRLRQLVSALESQLSGETILLIFPDGTGPAVLSALIAGIPLNRVHELELGPGEIRFNLTYDRIQTMWNDQWKDPAWVRNYQDKIEYGNQQLIELRQRSAQDGFMSLKDLRLEEERILMEQQYQAKQLERRQEEQRQVEERMERQRQIQQINNKNGEDGDEPDAVRLVLDKVADIPPIVSAAIGFAAVAGGGLAVGTSLPDQGQQTLATAGTNWTTSLSPSTSSNVQGAQTTTTTTNNTNMRASRNENPNEEDNNKDFVTATLNDDSQLGRDPLTIQQQQQQQRPGGVDDVLGNNRRRRDFNDNNNNVQDRFEAAERAMEEYLNQDDGGEAWLASVVEMLREDDTDTANDTESNNKNELATAATTKSLALSSSLPVSSNKTQSNTDA